MKKVAFLSLNLILAVQLALHALQDPQNDNHRQIKRIPWTTSRIKGSPEPPPPYRLERCFPNLTFKNPLLLVSCPGSDRLFLGEQAGKLYSFKNEPDVAKADLFCDLATELKSWDRSKVKGVSAVYALVFHPRFAENRYCYVCYVLDSNKPGEFLADGSRVSRFTVTDTDPPRIDPNSEKVIITWLAGGHNGCDLHFGLDGYLYISTGDATDPNPPDRLDTGQDLSDLLAAILRIDVDREDPGLGYRVPPDNPFVGMANVRPEIWAYGFRNPWRMSFDPVTGDLWVGDVGWEQWEMIYRIVKGGNYGWSVMEGPQVVRPESRRGPTPILPPAIAIPHTEGASVTGGYVYRGKRLPELVGTYVFGDWMSCKFWGARFDGDKLLSLRELAQSNVRVVAFGQDNAGELYAVHYDENNGAIFRLVPNTKMADTSALFPRKLSETGLFASVKDQTPAPGVVPYTLRAEPWADFATAERFVALPGTTTVRIFDDAVKVPGTAWFTARVFFPKDAVLARTISLELERGNPASRRRLETQILHFDGENWRGYTYEWNDAQTDATLVPSAGGERTFTVMDTRAPGGKRKQTWHLSGRGECLQCHNPWAGVVLGFTEPQLDRGDQLRRLEQLGIVALLKTDEHKGARKKPPTRMVDPYDSKASLGSRARSYLHVNCAHCHQFGAGGTADIDLRAETPLHQMKVVGVRPVQGTFEIAGAQLICPGDPFRSVLFFRMAKLGRGRMPHLGSEIPDERGLRLIHDWIRQLPPRDEPPTTRREEDTLIQRLLADKGPANEEDLQRLLGSTGSALQLMQALAEGRMTHELNKQVVRAALARSEPHIRDLFERFVPDEQRVKRLGTVIKPEQILVLKGDADRGKALFLQASGSQCVNCHRVHGTGSTLGPDLSQIGKKYSRAELLESILEPSKRVDPPYLTYLVETTDGQFHTGLLAEKNDREVVLRIAGDKEVRVPTKKVAILAPQKNSLMPELLLRDLTAEQVADLLEFLASLK